MSKGLFRPSNELEIVLDDESYFPLTGHNIPGNDGYYTSDKKTVDSDIKYNSKEKFLSKVMIWIAISSRGHSSAFMVKSKTMNSKLYAEECLTKRLIPFLNKHHSDGKYVFWPDGATCHYGSDSMAVYKKFNIRVVERDDNPPNIPQLRPIEKFWAHLKIKVYGNDWEADNHQHLVSRIRNKLKEFCPDYFRGLLLHCKTNIRQAADNGSESLLK